MTTDLITTVIHHDGESAIKFTMQEFELDGITYKNPNQIYDHQLFSLKTEIDDKGDPVDTGLSWRYNPTIVMSEKHWLSCSSIIAVGRMCVCGEIAE